MQTNNSFHYRNCNLCEAICGIEIEVQGDDRLNIRGDKEDPFSRGYICPKAVALQDIHYDKDRLKSPVRRTPHGWQRIDWDEAFDERAQNLRRINAQYGRKTTARTRFTTTALFFSRRDLSEACIREISFPRPPSTNSRIIYQLT